MINRAALITEKRSLPIELRAKGRRLEGYAALFGTEAKIGRITETIRQGAFKTSLSNGHDILALADHDPQKVLARTKSGTLRLAEDSNGLAFDLDLPNTSIGRDILELAERGDVGGMSFGFRAIDEAIDGNKRELRAVELYEISVVQAFPAYDGTSINARSVDKINPLRAEILRKYIEILGGNHGLV